MTSTTRNRSLVADTVAVAFILNRLPGLDDLPELHRIETVADDAGTRVLAQLLAGGSVIDALIAWRDALASFGGHVIAEELRFHPTTVFHVAAAAQIGGVPVEVWTHIAPDEQTAAAMRAAGDRTAAGGVLVGWR